MRFNRDYLHSTFFFFYQLASFTALCLFFFSQNKAALYLPYDGAYMQQLVKFNFEWSTPTANLLLNPLQGLGGIAIPLNHWFSPASLSAYVLGGAAPDKVMVYTFVALEFYVSMWFLAHAMGASRYVSAAASWLGTLLVMPFVIPPLGNNFSFYAICGIVPLVVESVVFSNIIIALLLLLRSSQPRWAIAYCLLALLVFIIFIVGFPGSIVLGLPLISVFCVYALIGRSFFFVGRGMRIGFGLSLIVLILLVMTYVLALLLPTVPSFFNSELIYGRGDWVFVSILFHGFHGLGWLSSIVFLTGIVGGVMAWRYEGGLLQGVARIWVIYAFLIVVVGLLLTFVFTRYRGPSLLYFEWFTWPLIFVYTCVLGEVAFRYHCHRMIVGRLAGFLATRRFSLRIFLVLVVPVMVLVLLLAVNRPKDMPALPPVPPLTPSLVEALVFHCSLSPGSAWRGSVATFTGIAKPGRSTSWLTSVWYDALLWQTTGNDHRSIGLWWHGVPTLFSYNQYMNPEYYYLMTRLFAFEHDQQQRSVVVLTRPNARLLGLFGVSYVLAEKELPAGQPVKLVQLNTLAATHQKGNVQSRLLLYKIDRPNLGNYTPTNFLIEGTANGTLSRIRNPEFQPEETVVLTEPIGGRLEKAKDTSFVWGRGNITVRAQSEGESLLVLPVQYSRCLEIEPGSGTVANGNPRLVRANLVLTGVLFRKGLNAKIRYNFGPFSNVMCRLQDYLEARRMLLGADASLVAKEE